MPSQSSVRSMPVLEDADRALLLVDLVVDVDAQPRGQLGHLLVPLVGLVGRAGDDQRRAGLVDQDRVDLVDDRVVVAALDHLLLRPRHVVAQVVEAELVVGAVGDVVAVLDAALRRGHLRQDHADLQAQEPVDAAHVLGVAMGQVVVDRDDVHPVAGEGVEVGRQGRDQGLALTGAHLGDVAQVQRRTTHDLDVVVPLAQGALGGLPDRREGLGQQGVEGLPVGDPLAVRGRQRLAARRRTSPRRRPPGR